MINYTWHILFVAVAGWMNRQQQEVIEFLKEENRILREKLGPARVLLNRLSETPTCVRRLQGRPQAAAGLRTLFSPHTLLKWHRMLVARKGKVRSRPSPPTSPWRCAGSSPYTARLDVSRIVSGKLLLEIHPCKLTEIIEAAIDAVRPTAEAKGVRIETDLDPAASPASCDKIVCSRWCGISATTYPTKGIS